MNTALHTPGPWAVKHEAYIVRQAHVDRPIGAHVDPLIDREKYAHTICTMAQRFGVNEANASLLAAAPELLEALRTAGEEVSRLAAFLVGYGDAADLAAKKLRALQPIIDAAIVKATGSASHG